MSDDPILYSLQRLVVHRPAVANASGNSPRSVDGFIRGQIRSLTFLDAENNPDRCFVLLVNSATTSRDVVQVMLIGHDEMLAGKNDVILHESERPMSTPSVVQTDFLFPALIADIGSVYSVLADETLRLISHMRRKSGRDAGRVGVISDDAHFLRADYLEEQMQVLRLASRSAVSVIYSSPAQKLDVVSIGLHGNLLDQMTIESRTTDDNVRDLISFRDKKEARRALEELQRQRQEAKSSGMKKVASL